MTMRWRKEILNAAAAALALTLWAQTAEAGEKADRGARLEGEYRIYFSGQEIGVEKYVLVTSKDSVTSSSVLNLQNPGESRQKVALESRLEMDGQYLPRSYELKSEVNGQKGSIRGNFAPNQVIFEYTANGVSQRSGLLLGNRFTILDSNTFHHFIFLARLFKYGSGDTPQAFEVAIPQEKDVGTLKIRELKKETILIRGKKISAIHLMIDSGVLQIQLWVDDDRIPRKIAVPDRGIEVVHSN